MSSAVSKLCVVVVLAASAVLLLNCPVQANTIVSDAFTGTNGAAIAGRTPDTADLPGGVYVATNGSYPATIQSGSANLSTDLGESVTIASAGSYVKPTVLTISASLYEGNLTADTPPEATTGPGLGFYSSQGGGGSGWNNFTGLFLNPNGNLELVSPQHIGVAGDAYVGVWNSAIYHTLSYTVDTVAGAISNVVLDGTSYSFPATTIFAGASATQYAGFCVESTTAGRTGSVENFVVSGPVPEPSTLLLLATGLLGLLAYAWRKRK